jgi:fructokinase
VTDSPSVLCIGELLIDLIASDASTSLEDAGTFVARPGGAPANVAVALARLGVPSAFCGVVGNDPFGRRLLHTLEANGVGTAPLRLTDEENTTIAFAWKNERGDGEFRVLRLADRLLNIDDIDDANIALAAAIVVGSVALAVNPSRVAIEHAVEI